MVKERVDKSRFFDPEPRCRCADCHKRGVHDHHVIYEQEVRKHGGDISDGRNAFQMCWDDHGKQHDGSPWRIKTTWLRDENIEFAFELLGLAAEYYFERHYDNGDPDPRIEHTIKRLMETT